MYLCYTKFHWKDILSCKLTPSNFLCQKRSICEKRSIYHWNRGHIFCPLGLFLLRLHPKDCLWVRHVNKLILILVSCSKVKVIADLLKKALSVFYFLTPWPSLSHTLAKDVVCSDLQSSVCVKFQGHIIPLEQTPVHSFFLS